MPRLAAILLLSSFLLALLPGCGGGSSPATNSGGTAPSVDAVKEAPRKHTIAVIPKSSRDEFWESVHQGAESAAQGGKVDIIFKAGEPGDDANAQLTLVDRLMAQADAIVLAPVHSKFMVQAVEKAYEKKIPMVIIDSGVDVDFNKYVSYVATDNKDGGVQSARRLAEAIGKRGSVLLFRYNLGSASTTLREDGFTETMAAEFPAIRIVAEKYAGITRDDSLKNANELLAANPVFDGVFSCNESSTYGMLLALREKHLAGKVKFVGFDTAKELVEAVKSGEIEALAAQNPFMIGSEGVKQAIAALEKQKTDPLIVIPAVMKDKPYFEKEAEEARQLEASRKQEEDDRRLEAEVKQKSLELEKQEAEQRRKLEALEKEQAGKKPAEK